MYASSQSKGFRLRIQIWSKLNNNLLDFQDFLHIVEKKYSEKN
jgi:hypothetical protein